jgi:hypothetical protein
MDNREAAADTRAWEDRPLWQTQLPQARQPQHWPAGASSWCPDESTFTLPLDASNHLRFGLTTPDAELSMYSTLVLHFGHDSRRSSLS